MREMEARREEEILQEWIAKCEVGTVAVESRQMREGRNKESMLNFAFVGQNDEMLIRSEDMAHCAKSWPREI